MKQILKRLELIKTAISIKDEEIIELQVLKLSSMATDDKVKKILLKISDSDYGSVVLDIEAYIAEYNGVVVYEDKELQGLKLELKSIEKQLQELSEEKNEYINTINDFNIQYSLKLGDIIQKILNANQEILRKLNEKKEEIFNSVKEEYEEAKESYDEIRAKKEKIEEELEDIDPFDDKYDDLYEELKETKEELDEAEEELNEKRKEAKAAKEEFEEDEEHQEYEEAKKEYEEFSHEYKEIKKEERFELDEEDEKELKKLYRKGSKICHPDIVADELKEQANTIFIELNDAYRKKDLEKVREIFLKLESGNGFDVASDSINDKELLKSKIADLRGKIDQTKEEIEEIMEDEIFMEINEIDDIDQYFEERKEALQHEYEKLKNQLLGITEEEEVTLKNSDKPLEDDDEFWDIPF